VELIVPGGSVEGVIEMQGDALGGLGQNSKDGKLKYCYNFIVFEHAFFNRSNLSNRGKQGAH
jgi:arylsulfatase